MRILVCGGRDFCDYKLVRKVLDEYPRDSVIVEGGAPGADSLARIIAEKLGFASVEEYKADWEQYGKAAGPIRNQKMLDSGIDLVIAFPGGRGTADTVRRARKIGVEVREIV